MKNILSFDVEEHFQVSGMEKAISRSSWDSFHSRVEQSAQKILKILDRYKVKATFFILGWIAERHPGLIKEIAKQGHEIASHGFDHKLVYNMTPEQFAINLKQTNDLLESITGQRIYGYRAPSFSLAIDDKEKFEILAKLGFTYDSSLFPMKHFRYGRAQSIPLGPFEIEKDGRYIIKEFPISVIKFLGKHIPAGAGGYFRLYPNTILRDNFKKVNNQERPVIIYLHPWEFDPEQPRVSGAGFGNTFRHYLNLDKTQSKLEMVLKEFEFGSFRDFIDSQS